MISREVLEDWVGGMQASKIVWDHNTFLKINLFITLGS